MDFTKQGINKRKKELNSISQRFGTTFKTAIIKLFIFGVIFLGVTGCSAVFGMVSGILSNTPDISTINVSPTKFATKIYDNQGTEIETLISEGSNRVYVPLSDIPSKLQHAFIAVEDSRFYTHNGIDLRGIARAASVAIKNFGLSEGASTITQQLIKNTVFEAYNESTIEKIERKLQEQYLAIKVDAEMGKDAVLENYLNIINLGNGNLGVQAAANNYFNKDVSELTLSECAVIAGITKNPYRLNPINFPENNRKRQVEVLDHMLDQGYITKAEYDEAYNDKVYDRIQDIHVENVGSSIYSYYTDALIDVVLKDLQEQLGYTEAQASNLLYSGGLSIYSTQDTRMQAVADRILNDPDNYPKNTYVSVALSLTVVDKDGQAKYLTHNHMLNYFQKDLDMPSFSITYKDQETAASYVEQYKQHWLDSGYEITYEAEYYTIQPQISFTLMDQYTGEVKVIVGGRGDKTTSRSLNRATNTYRSPGSTMKPLAVYAPAIDTGTKTLASVFDDCPYYYKDGGKLVANWNDKYMGIMGMREALYRSRNIPAVKCLSDITPEVGFSYLQDFGLSTLVSPENAINGLHDVIESMALGGLTLGVYNIDICSAYATFANDGVYTKPIYYSKIYDHDGNLLLDNSQPVTKRVLKDTTAWLMTNAMESVITNPGGTGGRCRIPNQPVAGKTGTTNSSSDLWFAGYTPYYTAAIWTGFDDNTKNVDVSHTTIWSKIMTEIHADLPTKSFPAMPETITQVQVCKQSGKLPVAGLCDCDERGSQIVTEYFAVGTEPTEYCDAHGIYNICGETGKVSVGTCPAIMRIMVRRPPNNTIVPEDAEQVAYPIDDAAYTVPYELESAICPVHGAWYLEQLGLTPNINGLGGSNSGLSIDTLNQQIFSPFQPQTPSTEETTGETQPGQDQTNTTSPTETTSTETTPTETTQPQ